MDFRKLRLARCRVMHSQHQLTGEVLNRAPQLVAGGPAYTPEDEAVFGEFWQKRRHESGTTPSAGCSRPVP